MKFVDLAVTTDARGHLFLAGYNYTWLGAAVQTVFFFFWSRAARAFVGAWPLPCLMALVSRVSLEVLW